MGIGSVGRMSVQSGLGILPMNVRKIRGTFNSVNLVTKLHRQDAHATTSARCRCHGRFKAFAAFACFSYTK